MVSGIGDKIVVNTLKTINTYNTNNTAEMMKNTFDVTEDVVGSSMNLQNNTASSVNQNPIQSSVKGTLFDLLV